MSKIAILTSYLYYCILGLSICIPQACTNPSPRLIIELSRHGPREFIYPNYIVSEEQKELPPYKLGQLTKAGLELFYNRGVHILSKYFNKTPLQFEEIEIYSSSSPRNVVSYQAHILGILGQKPEGEIRQIMGKNGEATMADPFWTESRFWLGQNNHKMKIYLDGINQNYLCLTPRICQSMLKTDKLIMKYEKYELPEEIYTILLPQLRKYFNIDENTSLVSNLYYILDNYKAAVYHKESLLYEFSEETVNLLEIAYEAKIRMLFGVIEEQYQLYIYLLSQKLINILEDLGETKFRSKFIFFCFHDTTMMAFLKLAGYKEHYSTHYDSHIILEIYEDEGFRLKFNLDGEYPEVLGGDQGMGVKDFIAILQGNMLKRDFHEACFEDDKGHVEDYLYKKYISDQKVDL